LLGLLLTSNGVPLLQQGDEFGRTKSSAGQDGAKNSWDWESTSGDAGVNGVNWLDWGLKDGKSRRFPKWSTLRARIVGVDAA
jgi:pullulanase/glycogen debranching enzyme